MAKVISNSTRKFYDDNFAKLFAKENLESEIMIHAKEITAKAKAFRKSLNSNKRSDFDIQISILILDALANCHKNQVDYRKIDANYLANSVVTKEFDLLFVYEEEILKILFGWPESYAFITLTGALLDYNEIIRKEYKADLEFSY